MKLKTLISAVLILFLVSCASKSEKKKALKPFPLVEFEATTELKRNWSVSIGDGQDKRYAHIVPKIEGDTLYATDVKGRIFAFDKNTRKKLWSVNTKKDISASVNVVDGKLYFGTYKGELVALDAATGESLWQSEASSEILGVPAANNDVVVAQTIDGRLFAYSTESGEQLWRYDHTVPALTLRGTANPIITRSQVIAAFANGQIVSLNTNDGSLQWSGRVSQPKGRTELEKMVDVDGTPIEDGGLIYAASYRGAIVAFSKTKGQVIWKQDLSTYQNIAVSGNTIFAITDESHIVAFNSGNGVIEWTNDQLHLRGVGAPITIGNYLAVIDKKGYMHVMSQKDGAFSYRFKPKGKGFRSPMTPYNDAIMVLSNDGTLSAYSVVE